MFVVLEIVEDEPFSPELMHDRRTADAYFDAICEEHSLHEHEVAHQPGHIKPLRCAGDAAGAVYLWEITPR